MKIISHSQHFNLGAQGCPRHLQQVPQMSQGDLYSSRLAARGRWHLKWHPVFVSRHIKLRQLNTNKGV